MNVGEKLVVTFLCAVFGYVVVAVFMFPLFVYLAAAKTPAQKVCETKAVYFRDPVKVNLCYGMFVVPIPCDQVKNELTDYFAPSKK